MSEQQEDNVHGDTEIKAYVPISAEERALQREAGIFSIYLQNCYLIPSLFTYNPIFSTCVRQEERATGIGRLCSYHDICALQEVWGSSNPALYEPCADTHSIMDDRKTSRARFGWMRTLRDSMHTWWNSHGGLHAVWRNNITLLSRRSVVFERSVPLTNQGVECMEYDMKAYKPGKKLLVFNTHFDVQSKDARLSNLYDLRQFMLRTVSEVLKTNETMENYGVLLVGDFNIDANHRGGNTYKKLKQVAALHDLFRDAPEYKQTAYRYTLHQRTPESQTGNSMFPWPVTKRVDTVFAVSSITFSGDDDLAILADPTNVVNDAKDWNADEEEEPDLSDVLESKKEQEVKENTVVRFAALRAVSSEILRQPYGQELSDHYGVSTTIQIL